MRQVGVNPTGPFRDMGCFMRVHFLEWLLRSAHCAPKKTTKPKIDRAALMTAHPSRVVPAVPPGRGARRVNTSVRLPGKLLQRVRRSKVPTHVKSTRLGVAREAAGSWTCLVSQVVPDFHQGRVGSAV